MEAFVDFFRQWDPRLIKVLAAVVLLWIFAKAFRWFIKLAFIVALIFVVFWKVPMAHDVLVALIN